MALGVVLAAPVGGGAPALAQTATQAPQKVLPACWFYQYKWVYYRMIPNVAPPTTFPTSGSGTGVMVTDGHAPSPVESDIMIADIVRGLPRGDEAAPPPQAFMQNISRIACPKPLATMDLDLARVWLHQPPMPSAVVVQPTTPQAPAPVRR